MGYIIDIAIFYPLKKYFMTDLDLGSIVWGVYCHKEKN